MIYVPEIFADIVARVNTTWNGQPLTFIPGSKKEIEQTLVEWSKDPDKKDAKYPCLILFTPIPQVQGDQGKTYDSVATVNMALLMTTEKTYHLQERIDNVYKPVLDPIYELFKTQLLLSNYFDWENSRVNITPENIYHYSPTEAKEQNVFSAVLDAIEMNNVELKIFKKCLTT